jgi:AraC family transcriptional activator of pobA
MAHEVISQISPSNVSEVKLKGFKAYEVESTDKVYMGHAVPSYSRRDYYKICLSVGHLLVHYTDRTVKLDGPCLFFGNPRVPYWTELLSDKQTGYACLFTEGFIKAGDRSESLQQSPLFKIGGTPAFALTAEQVAFVRRLFQKMLTEQSTDYSFKSDLMRTYIQLLIHEALQLQPSENMVLHQNAASRLTTQFLETLEQLFPIESPHQSLALKTAHDFASKLAVHVNHLNRAVKEVTGKSTTAHIAERVITEAKVLLQYTDWTVAQISQSLGFEYATYFNNFFKKHTGMTPNSMRQASMF